MNQDFMKERAVLPLVLSLSLPMVISMAVNSLYNIVDSYFVAKVSEEAMTALSLVFPAQNMVNSIAVGFGVGMNALIAFYLGAGNKTQADQAASQGLWLSILHGIVLTVVCLVAMTPFLRLFTANDVVVELGTVYSNIVFLFSAVVTASVAMEKIFQAVGSMNIAMISMSCGFAANIVLDPLLIFGMGPFPELGISGAAIATAIGQLLSLGIYIWFYLKRPLPVKISLGGVKISRQLANRLYSIGIPATLNMALPSVLVGALNAVLAVYSEAYVLVLGVYYKLQTFIYMPANGIIQGIRPLVGFNYGAGETERVEAVYKTALLLIGAIMAVGTLLCWLMPDKLIGLFTDNPATGEIGVAALQIISLGFIVSTLAVTTAGALEGLGQGLASLVISLLRYVVVIIPVALILNWQYGAVGVWQAFGISEFVTAAAAYVIGKTVWRARRAEINK